MLEPLASPARPEVRHRMGRTLSGPPSCTYSVCWKTSRQTGSHQRGIPCTIIHGPRASTGAHRKRHQPTPSLARAAGLRSAWKRQPRKAGPLFPVCRSEPAQTLYGGGDLEDGPLKPINYRDGDGSYGAATPPCLSWSQHLAQRPAGIPAQAELQRRGKRPSFTRALAETGVGMRRPGTRKDPQNALQACCQILVPGTCGLSKFPHNYSKTSTGSERDMAGHGQGAAASWPPTPATSSSSSALAPEGA